MLLDFLGAFVQFARKGSAGSSSGTVYLERDGEILIFRNRTHAAEYIAFEKAQAAKSDVIKPKVSDKPRIIKPRNITPVKRINMQLMEAHYRNTPLYPEYQNAKSLMLIDILIKLYIKAFDCETDDLEVLLLAA